MKAIEKLIVTALVLHLSKAGYEPSYVDDPEAEGDEARVTDADSIIRYTEEVDLLTYPVVFRPKGVPAGERRWLVLIPGNGEDLLSDYGLSRTDEKWNAALDSFLDVGLPAWRSA